MTDQAALHKKINFSYTCILVSSFLSSLSTYLIVPLFPIYLVEAISNGGLAWSKTDTFSLFGSFLALLYVSPFIGGLVSDFMTGKKHSALLGYILGMNGLMLIKLFTSKDLLYIALLFLALGFGFVKVNLTAFASYFLKDIGNKGYEYFYIASSLGFISGGLISFSIFTACGMSGVTVTVLCTFGISAGFFILSSRGVLLQPSSKTSDQEATSSSPTPSIMAFVLLLFLSIPFFLCTSQVTTSMPLFLHQCVNRTLLGWKIPALWFGAIGSLSMMLLSPWLRKKWNEFSFYFLKSCIIKFFVSFLIMTISFAISSLLASLSLIPFLEILLLLFVHILCCIADYQIRPVLYTAATSMIPLRFQTISTALVYCCIGFGGKLAGILTSYVDTIGFHLTFLFCSLIALLATGLSFLWWRKTPDRKPIFEIDKNQLL